MDDKELLQKIFQMRKQIRELREIEKTLIHEYNQTFGLAELPARAYQPRNHTLSADETVKLGGFLSKPRSAAEIISTVNHLLEKRKQ